MPAKSSIKKKDAGTLKETRLTILLMADWGIFFSDWWSKFWALKDVAVLAS